MTTTHHEELDHYYDLGTLTVYNTEALKTEGPLDKPAFESFLTKTASSNYRLMLQQLLRLKEKTSSDVDGKELKYQIHDFEKNLYELDLPEMRTEFPRFRKLPEKDKLTKWEKFAEGKGINKTKKRSRMVFDEVSKDWVPRWGYGSIKQIAKRADFIRPVKPGQDPKQDPWAKDKMEKELGENKQKQAELKNRLQ